MSTNSGLQTRFSEFISNFNSWSSAIEVEIVIDFSFLGGFLPKVWVLGPQVGLIIDKPLDY